MDQTILITALVFLLVSQAALLAGTVSYGERERVADRLTSYTAPTFSRTLASVTVLRRRRYSRFPLLDSVLARVDVSDGLGLSLQQAGVPLRGGEFLFAQLMLATVTGLGGVMAGWDVFGGPLAGFVAAIGGFVAPMVWLRMRVSARKTAFEQGLPEALDRITGALRAGYGLEYGFDLVARESSGPCAEEFGQILQELNLGGDLEEALTRLVQRVTSEDARLLATAVAVQRRTGGNLVEVLGQMAAVLRERERLRRDVRVMTTAPRVSGYVVALLPLITTISMYFTSKYYIDTLLSDPIGQLAVGVGACLVVVGLFLNHRIAQVDL